MPSAVKIALTLLLSATRVVSTLGEASAQSRGVAGIDLSKYTEVLVDEFDDGLNKYDGMNGVWSTSPRREVMITNGPRSVFLDGDEATPRGDVLGLDPFSVENGILHIGSGVIPPEKRAVVSELLESVRQRQSVFNVQYYTGTINTSQTWAQTYGFFEIVARIPKGKGHWPAFWLSPAGIGWPPEIDIFEAYGKGVLRGTRKDNTFNVAVYFDAVDPDGESTQSVDIDNPYHLDDAGNPMRAEVRAKGTGEQHVFHRRFDARGKFGADIYNEFWTYALEWAPDQIIFYFGSDRRHLAEIYRTPTPDDLNSPMTLTANDQISSTFGWNPVPGQDQLTFATGNDLAIESISVYALNPERILAGTGNGALVVDDDDRSRIVGTAGNDVIVTGRGLDLVDLKSGGRDVIHVVRGPDSKIVTGFQADDRLVLEGFYFDGSESAQARLTQVGDDVWLINGAAPANPQTIVFKQATLSHFTAENFIVRWPVTPNTWSSARLDDTRLADEDGDGIVEAAASGSKITDVSNLDGAMELRGSHWPDIYFIYRPDTRIIESTLGGVDTVYTNRSYTLPDQVENLVSTAKRGKRRLEGNSLSNRLQSHIGGETLVGLHGDDLIDLRAGGANRVVYSLEDGHDTILGFGADDVLDLQGFAFPSWQALSARLQQLGSDVWLNLGEKGQSVTFRKISLDTLRKLNFSFATGPNTLGTGRIDPWWVPNVHTPESYMQDRADGFLR